MLQKFTLPLVAAAFLFAVDKTCAQDITSGLIGHWKFDEPFGAETAVDSAGTNDGVIEGAVFAGLPGRVDNGYIFGGSGGNRVLTEMTADTLGLNSGPFSMFTFIKTPEIGAVQRHIISGNNGAAGRWNLGINGNSGNLFWFHNGGPGGGEVEVDVTDNEYHLVGVSKDASNNYSVYLDSTTFSLATDATPLNDSPIAFGDRPTANTFPYAGVMDDVRIYNRVLSPLDIQALLDQPFPPSTDENFWLLDGSDSWHNTVAWSNGVIPNSNTAIATLGPVLSSPRVVAIDTPATVKSLKILSGSDNYAIAGTSQLTLDADSGNASLSALGGSPQLQVAVSVADNLDLDVGDETTLSFNNALDLNGHTLSKTGNGRLNVNNLLHNGGGTVDVTAGVLGGNGEVGGDLNAGAGSTVAPGTSVGILGVAGDYTQSAGASLQVELAGNGAEQFDLLEVEGTADLAGSLEISLLEEYTPTDGQTFEVLTAASVVDAGLTLAGASTGFSLTFNPTSLVLTYNAVSGLGDYNGNGVVDAADYTVWRDTLDQTVENGTGADGSGNGVIDADDYTVWKNNFGNVSGASSAAGQTANVPEPASALLTMAGVLGLLVAARPGRG